MLLSPRHVRCVTFYLEALLPDFLLLAFLQAISLLTGNLIEISFIVKLLKWLSFKTKLFL